MSEPVLQVKGLKTYGNPAQRKNSKKVGKEV